MRFQNGCNKVAIELRVVQFWSEIILVISNQTRAARSFDFEITRMISDQIALHSVQYHYKLILLVIVITFREPENGSVTENLNRPWRIPSMITPPGLLK